MITDPSGLEEFLDQIAPLRSIAVDTEADSLHCYFEKLCLVQVGTPDENVLIDPLADVPMQPLLHALQEKRLVMHGGDYDLRMLRRVGLFEPGEIMDTMIAARLCGMGQLSLAALVERYFGVRLCKASQKANWAQRPLSSQMTSYAINDTKYLLKIAELLESELRSLERWEWFTESIDRMIATSRDVRERDENVIWRISGTARLNPRAQSILRILWFWRDAEARGWDRPPFHVIGNEDLLKIADKASRGEAFSTPRMPNRRRRGFEIVLALALQIPQSEWPIPERRKGRRRTANELRRFDQLKAIRDSAAVGLGLDPAILAPRAALEAAALNPGTDALMNWQRRLIGLDPVVPRVYSETMRP